LIELPFHSLASSSFLLNRIVIANDLHLVMTAGRLTAYLYVEISYSWSKKRFNT